MGCVTWPCEAISQSKQYKTMKYTIQRSIKKTTQTGKPFIKATLKDETGQEVDNVSIWSDFPNFEVLTPGVETTGVIETNPQGFRNLKPATMGRMMQPQEKNSPVPQQQRTPMYEQRVDAIRRAQERKYEAISYFNATNSAISLVSNLKAKLMNGNVNRSVMKQEIMFWRDWFIDEWKDYERNGFKAEHKGQKNDSKS
jgi:hypothetical protein